MDDFLKQGGINLDEEDQMAAVKDDEENKEDKKENEPPQYNTDPDDRMCGFLTKSSVKLPGGAAVPGGLGADGDILGMVVSGIGSGLKLGLKTFTETIQIK